MRMLEYIGTSAKDKIKSNALCVMILSGRRRQAFFKDLLFNLDSHGWVSFSVIKMGLKAF